MAHPQKSYRPTGCESGLRDASQWSEHEEYLDRLGTLLPAFDDVPTVVAGDFNQRIPRVRQPVRVAAALAEVFTDWTIYTAGGFEHGPHIDHIASNHKLVCRSVADWPGSDASGRLSDHGGVSCQLSRA